MIYIYFLCYAFTGAIFGAAYDRYFRIKPSPIDWRPHVVLLFWPILALIVFLLVLHAQFRVTSRMNGVNRRLRRI